MNVKIACSGSGICRQQLVQDDNDDDGWIALNLVILFIFWPVLCLFGQFSETYTSPAHVCLPRCIA